MKQILQSYFWIFHIFFFFSSSYLLAQTTSHIVRLRLPHQRAFALQEKSTAQDSGYQRNVRAHYAILNQKNLFDEKQQAVTPPVAPRVTTQKEPPKTYKPCDPNASYRRSQLPLQLKGTSVASDPSYSVAILYDAKSQSLVAVRPGDKYQGIVICDIEAGPLFTKKVKRKEFIAVSEGKSVAVEREEEVVDKKPSYVKLDRGNGQFEYLEQGAPPGSGAGNYQNDLYKQYRRLRDTNLNLSQIRKTGNQEYALSRDLLESVTKRLDVLASQAAIVPYFQKGQPAGFRIYHIRPNSLYQKLGLTNGDVIQRINGYEFTSPQKALEAYSNLMSAKNLSVEVLRGGKLQNYSYEIKD